MVTGAGPLEFVSLVISRSFPSLCTFFLLVCLSVCVHLSLSLSLKGQGQTSVHVAGLLPNIYQAALLEGGGHGGEAGRNVRGALPLGLRSWGPGDSLRQLGCVTGVSTPRVCEPEYPVLVSLWDDLLFLCPSP